MTFENTEVYKKNDSCKLPIVGIVVTISPSFNLYKIVVFPAASSPTKKNEYKYIISLTAKYCN